MKPQFSSFAHDVDARCDVKISQLIRNLGYAGYGVFWAIIEFLNAQDDCRLPYDLKWLAWELHAPLKKVEAVVKNYGLFEIHEDEGFFLSKSALRRRSERLAALAKDTTKTTKRGPAKNLAGIKFPKTNSFPTSYQNESVVKSSGTPQIFNSAQHMVDDTTGAPKVAQNAKETASAQCQPSIVNQNATKEVKIFPDDYCECGCGCDAPNVDEQILAHWNQVFKGTNRVQRGTCLSPTASFRLHQTLEAGYTLEEVKKAINAARRDSYQWYLPAVLKEDNVQRLLTKRIDKNGSANNSDSYDGIDYSFMDGKEYYDAKGNLCPEGGEFMSAEFWDDLDRARQALPF